jgi:hypothetical protein
MAFSPSFPATMHRVSKFLPLVTEFGEDLSELGIVRKGFASLYDQVVGLVALFGVFRAQGCEAFLRRDEIREATQDLSVGSGCRLGFATLKKDRSSNHQHGDISRIRFEDIAAGTIPAPGHDAENWPRR